VVWSFPGLADSGLGDGVPVGGPVIWAHIHGLGMRESGGYLLVVV
jgi:hypothetical protein